MEVAALHEFRQILRFFGCEEERNADAAEDEYCPSNTRGYFVCEDEAGDHSPRTEKDIGSGREERGFGGGHGKFRKGISVLRKSQSRVLGGFWQIRFDLFPASGRRLCGGCDSSPAYSLAASCCHSLSLSRGRVCGFWGPHDVSPSGVRRVD